VSADLLDPIVIGRLHRRHLREGHLIGWPCDAQIEKLRDAFAKDDRPDAEAQGTGESPFRCGPRNIRPVRPISASSTCPMAIRKNITGSLSSPAPVFWNVKKAQ
jgi:peptide/nickel transport system substrate-binding protein